MSSRLAITQNFEVPLAPASAGSAANAGSKVQTETASAFSRLIQELTSESPAPVPVTSSGSKTPLADTRGSVAPSDSAHTPAVKLNKDVTQRTWGQGFGPAAGLPPVAGPHVGPGTTGDLVVGVPAAATTPQPQTSSEITGNTPEPETEKSAADSIPNQSPPPVTDEETTLPQIKTEPIEQHSPIAAPRQQQKSTPSKTRENTPTAPVIIAPPTPAPVPIIVKLPAFTPRPTTTGSSDHTEDSRPVQTTSRRAARAENPETLELRPTAALEVTLRSRQEPVQTPVEVAPALQPTPSQPVTSAPQSAPQPQSEPQPQSAPQPQSGPTPQVAHIAATQPVPQVQETTSIPVPTPAPVTQPHTTMVAPTPQAHYSQTTHSTPKSDTPPPSSVSHLDEMAEEPKQQPQALRSLSLEFTPDGAQDVRLRLAERAGDVHISLHSTDPALSGRLSDGVHDLVGNLSSAGYDAHAWTPEQGRQNNQRQFEDQRRGRRNPSPEQGAEEFGGLMQQPIQEVS